ncbi:MAG: hypothetical protein LAT67_08050 [Balneolales bacterium]|nr:hypothetical protein [Balneolales bacterium]
MNSNTIPSTLVDSSTSTHIQRLNRYFSIFIILIAGAWFAAACSSSSSDPGLDGDLSIQVSGPEGLGMFVSYATWDSGSQEMDFDGTTASIPASGTYTMNIDGSGFDGLEVVVSLFDENASVVVSLLSDGEIVAESDSPDDEDMYVITVGDFPDFDF